ncbi:hypothetical protein JB92DRAFT_2928574 [Gautieria morchelliformis]|nr:hypothetical protein JB92DRAFT_2928574 [Gautieria morchelliformis]
MPPTTSERSKPTYHALVTGYGPFSIVTDNPSWRAVVPLHNTLIHTDSATIHVTAIGPLEVTYSTILSVVPGLHARPPQLPPLNSEYAPMPEPVIAPPPEGYDLTFHLGAGRNGALSIEQVGHKTGYRSPGVDGKMAPVVAVTSNRLGQASAAEQFETERLRQGTKGPNGNALDDDVISANAKPEPSHGFAKGYECFPEELRTEVDVPGLIKHLEQQGETRVVASVDAGHFLCDFICFGSLAESQRPLFGPPSDTKAKRSKSLFMHVPHDEHEPHTIEEMTEAARQMIAWVCTKEKALPI